MASDKSVNKNNESPSSSSDSESCVDESLKSIGSLKLDQLKRELRSAGIKFDDKMHKPELQAILCLCMLGYLASGQTANQDAVQTIAQWCKIPLPDLGKELDDRKMKRLGIPKWERVERLILNDLTSKSALRVPQRYTLTYLGTSFVISESRNNGKSTKKGGKIVISRGGKSISGESPTSQVEPKLDPEAVSPDVVNLLVSSIYNMIVVTRNVGRIHGYSPRDRKGLLEDLDDIPRIDNAAQLKDLLAASPTSSTKLLRWICDTYGSQFVVLSEDHRIRGFEADTPQFAVLGSTGEAPIIMRKSGNGDKPEGTLLFHGTSIANLLPILSDGFNSPKGLCLTAEPNHAMGYAQNMWLPKRAHWKHSPFQDYGVLLGCRVVAQEEPDPNEIAILEHPTLATVRYLFLIPPPRFGPPRKTVEISMLAGFKAIREGNGRTLGEQQAS
ncbi:hypothetical protein EG329_006529 [Mollisiaceae sp. DMI_Dod_QoI]|nr:hypothetical protein EG329_006529 [Helotiales sp. DMI_Dod_QoI]